MKFRSILVPYDWSQPANDAFSTALDLAKGTEGVTITLLTVVDNEASFDVAARMSGVNATEVETAKAQHEADRLKDIVVGDKMADEIAAAGCEVRVVALTGQPHDIIPAFTAENAIDLVVMGSRGLGAIKGLVGSVSKSVLGKVRIPVLVVR